MTERAASVEASIELDPAVPASWTDRRFDDLLALSREEVEGAQLEAMARRFHALRPQVAALDKLASRQGVDRFDSIDGALPVFFDHRVYKSYPLSLIEKRQFDRLTTWLQRLTAVDLSVVPLDGLASVDDWLQRLDDHGMIVGHSTGTTGKLSFIPRSQAEWPAWKAAYFQTQEAASGVDFESVSIPTFSPGYRSGHHFMAKMHHLFAEASAGGEANRHVLYDYAISSDLLSLAGRLRGAEERGELDSLEFDPELLVRYRELIERGRHRDDDLQRWFAKLAEEYRGQRVVVRGTSADLVKLTLTGREMGITCEFTPDSVLVAGGGLKGLTDVPADWRDQVMRFFGVDRICSSYGMSEVSGPAPKCPEGSYHFMPYTVPVVLDEDANALPRTGVQTGRLALFDLLAESYWGAFISGDRVTMHWDDDCGCGWKAPRIEDDIQRFAHMEGGDDKITCAGTAAAYNAFMDYVSGT